MEIISRVEFASAINLNKFKMNSLASPIMKVMKIDELNKLYNTVHSSSGIEFIDEVLKELEISIEVDEKELQNIPKEGGFIALSNHPYGGIDGLILLNIFSKIRPDFKLIANFILKRIHNIDNFIIPVNPFENLHEFRNNFSGVKQTIEFLEKGYPIGIFPAGEVSAYRPEKNKITDKEWHRVVGRLITKVKQPVLPVYFHGSNSHVFSLLGLIHPGMRTARLPFELLNKRGQTIKVRIGKLIPAKSLSEIKDNNHLLRYLRAKTYALGSALDVDSFFLPPQKSFMAQAGVEKNNDDLIEKEISSLYEKNLLFSKSNFDAFIVKASKIPNIIHEIGRLREITFREIGEGTNKEIDLDEFDLYYQHLFLWDKKEKKIVGAYRIGKGEEIYEKFRKKGFYLNSLFEIRNEFVPVLYQSAELGRSFITKAYQQHPLTLMLLWKGILTIINRNPEIKYLIGPVSISNNFSKVSQMLIMDFIKKNCFDEKLAQCITPRKMFKPVDNLEDKDLLLPTTFSLKSLDDLIAEIEPKHYKVPVLLKKYLKQNGKIIGFNIDPKFSNALDGFLILKVEDIPADTISLLGD